MGGELRIRVAADRTPPQLDGLEVDDGEWRLSLDAHRDLLLDLTGVDPDGVLALRDLVTIRARLEGYVERERRPAERTGGSDATRAEPSRDRASGAPLGFLRGVLERLRAALSRGGSDRSDGDEAADRRSDDPPYPVATVRKLAAVFRAAADARRREIVAANAARTADGSAD